MLVCFINLHAKLYNSREFYREQLLLRSVIWLETKVAGHFATFIRKFPVQLSWATPLKQISEIGQPSALSWQLPALSSQHPALSSQLSALSSSLSALEAPLQSQQQP